ncbi:MAG: MBL fold metallo-hydrolase [Hyphomicrobiales bacterium]|nr:MAG: MBL fold metallo-hydrolase [Hyphomicrobiales bacterium]
MARKGTDEFVFVPLGGVGEIGMNMALYGFGPADDRYWIMVDCGVSFADETAPGVDILMADTRFIEEERKNLIAIVLTHAHEDHYGAVLDLWPRLKVPVYATPFTAGMLQAKAAGQANAPKIPLNVLGQGSTVKIGPFEVEFLTMSHSIPEPNALAIRTPLGTAIHTGDWKIDHEPGVGVPIDIDRLAAVGREGVRALICDSTNAIREGRSPSEGEVAKGLTEVIAAAKKRVAVTLFSSNVARIRAVALAAKAAGRDVVVLGRSIKRVADVARELGYLDDLPPFLDEEAYGYLPPENVVALCTGSQGEPRAALARIAAGDHRHVTLNKGDLVIFSSRTIPGNEKAVNAVVNALSTRGVEIMTDRDALIHTSGHPRRDELRELYGLLKPELAVPVHGEALHLAAHADLARELGVPEVVETRNGRMVRLAPGRGEIIDEVPVGLLYREGNLIAEPEVSGVRERRRIAYAGHIVIALVQDTKGNMLADPEIVLAGLPETDADGDVFEDVIYDAVEGAIRSIPKSRRKDPNVVAEAARRAARAAVLAAWGKKPLCQAIVSVV